MRRRHGRHGSVLPFVLGAFIAAAFVGGVIVYAVIKLIPYLVLAAVLLGVFVLLKRSFRSCSVDAGPAAASVPAPESGLQAWQRAKAEFDALRVEYTAHECDPMQVLRRPALSDVSVPSTARFVDAFAEAQSLDTDAHPGAPYDAAFTVAVAKARRAWQAALDAADRIRLSNVPTHERGSIERVLKLLTTARDSDSEHERLAAYARARSELDRLDRAGIVHLPRTARAAVDEASRGALPG
ncbi:hypothetical protein [Pseudonocardia sediminis]|nr:hypothetical protein [Pseudonocardia sediminis]